MLCPFRIITETKSSEDGKTTITKEFFANCIEDGSCTFYHLRNGIGVCGRVEAIEDPRLRIFKKELKF